MKIVEFISHVVVGSGFAGVAIFQIRKGLDKYWEYRMSKNNDDINLKITKDNNRTAIKIAEKGQNTKGQSPPMTRAS